jgi:threonine/homoserine/homoserine lactone efflux protein
MDATLLLKGLVLGFSIAAPVGPIGVLCIRRTLAEGRAAGLASGLGAASADAFYGCIAGFGLTFLSNFLINQQFWLRLAGGLFLVFLGIKTWFARPSETSAPVRGRGLPGAYSTTLLLTLSNPLTILSFVAIYAGLGIADGNVRFTSAILLVMGVFSGSALWWMILSGGVGLVRERLSADGLAWVNRLSALVIAGFGLFALMSLLR